LLSLTVFTNHLLALFRSELGCISRQFCW